MDSTDKITDNRLAGILMPVSALPSAFGIGTFGSEAYRFVNFLADAGQSVWQVLPLVPTGMGGSPYQSISAQAIDVNYIDLQDLVEQGLLQADQLDQLRAINGDRVDYDALTPVKLSVLRAAYDKFVPCRDYLDFVESKEFLDYAVFMSLKEDNPCAWYEWQQYSAYDSSAIENYAGQNRYKVGFYLWTQWVALTQWRKLRDYANSKGVRIMGDMPIYVALDSVETWSRPQNFQLDDNFVPKAVAGVPPDYFCEEGQLWGNPLYDWDKMKQDGYAWWNNRIRRAFDLYDVVRIDHFRAMDRYYSVPYGAKNAIDGEWKDSVGFDLFADKLDFNIVAEDLGLIDDGVKELLKKTGYCGMRVVQFGMDGDVDNDNRPSNYPRKSVAYTGTHDNDTLMGFVEEMDSVELSRLVRTIKDECSLMSIECSCQTKKDIADALIRLVLESNSNLAIVPMQDWLYLGSDSRINTPGTVSTNNWSCTITLPGDKELSKLAKKIRKITRHTERIKTDNKIKKTTYDLGVNVAQHTTFALWSPPTNRAIVEIFDDAYADKPIASYDMNKDGDVFRCTVEQNLTGRYYQFNVDGRACVDPYARAIGINGCRAMIVDLQSTDPPLWNNDRYKGNDTPVIWEVHVRDFSIAMPASYEVRGKYNGFETGRKTICGKACLVDYLKELGVTYVQLLPIADFESVDESDQNQRNWGYDPCNYNVPEGSYSTNPYDPQTRIKELKQLILTLHDNGIGVIMDVVYNHTYRTADSNLERIAKDCYYRKFSDGRFYNGSGCGNEIATEKPMVRKFIIDSLTYWAEEYHIDGFRFDLMGLYDVDTVAQIRNTLDRLQDKLGKTLLTYGEPWWALPPAPWIVAADCNNLPLLPQNMGVFNSSYRDGLRGNNNLSKGFLQGMAVSLSAVMSGIEGACKKRDGIRFVLNSPAQNVCYMSAHDNYTLYDQLRATMPSEREIKIATRFGAFYLMSSLGLVFMQGGEEFCRTKNMNDNSYNADDSVNALDWNRKDAYSDVADYYKGLIRIRRHNKVFRNLDEADKEFEWLAVRAAWGALAYRIGDYIYVANPTDGDAYVDLTEFGELERLADIDTANLYCIDKVSGDIKIPSKNLAIFRKTDR
ncbi:MAG: type I pullulanase [Christensenellales bacterium]